MALWYPDAARMQEPDNGSFTGGPPKGLLHSTEVAFGRAWATYVDGSKPHFEAFGDTATHTVKFRQFYPLDQPSRSLRDTSGWVRTNRDGVIQIEMGFKAADVANVPDWFWDGMRPLLRWIEDNAGVDPAVWADFKAYPDSFGYDNGVRFSSTKWDNYNGWCGHQHCPENDHGDPGAVPVSKLRADWFDMATKDDLRAVLDEKINASNPAFVNAVRVAIDAERADDADAVWQELLTHPATGSSSKAQGWLMYTNSKIDDLRTYLQGKLGQ